MGLDPWRQPVLLQLTTKAKVIKNKNSAIEEVQNNLGEERRNTAQKKQKVAVNW